MAASSQPRDTRSSSARATPERGRATAEEIGAVGHGTYADAIAQSDAFLLAVNWWDIETVLPLLGDVDGKILIDCTNPARARP